MASPKRASATMLPNTKLKRRFYESIVFGVALKNIFHNNFEVSDRTPNSEPDANEGAEQAYHRFVYRLAHICDNEKGGSTVTAIAVLEEPDCIRYLVGSNERKGQQEVEVKDFLTKILRMVGKWDHQATDEHTTLCTALFRSILQFNLPRIKAYLAHLAKALDLCIDHCDRDINGMNRDSEYIKGVLSTLRTMTGFHPNREMEHGDYMLACQRLIREIHRNHKISRINEAIVERAKEGQIDSSDHWVDLRHVLGRLHAYYQDVETIIGARRRWVQLFHDFEVTVIQSSQPAPSPLKGNKTNAHDTIGRMVSSTDEMARYRGYAAELQTFGLDEQISLLAKKESFRPIVHAEVLVHGEALDRIKASGPERRARFWNDWKYVGSSKPTCRLCRYYFDVHPGAVQVRSTHRNLYPRWRLPDAHDPASTKTRDTFLNDINKKLREDVLRTLQERIPQGKKHDSNTTSQMPAYFGTGDTDAHRTVSDLASRFSGMGMSVGVGEDFGSPRKEKKGPPSVKELQEEDEDLFDSGDPGSGGEDVRNLSGKADTSEDAEDSDDNGGVLLYTGRR
ncbi:hypothetical protein SODALDRAFT_332098 [Sodiomyces alkalinus F11]|uniref:Uncharacterized protein n=1 Tax=Sodiomyces alkalinus (strain CBS 110278 / VKM F-3762 / F11) TaxID=1314773 RepID=A0A3N2PZJ5_SODAK|nr:hypothetical protein SODALDRAFT_332098 [Sodiomyces alkalinus F11]ROT39949.1 hypothetical protein SODALDRAFT_332098 [Sodiomyces alkalinus F11]